MSLTGVRTRTPAWLISMISSSTLTRRAPIVAQFDTAHAGGLAAHGSYFVLEEPDCLPARREQQDVLRAVRDRHAHQLVALIEGDRNDAAGPGPGEQRQRGLLHGAQAGR